ncbi:hypothetical protein WICPIJ_001050, partial [Wickerhamomyces pijperi]
DSGVFSADIQAGSGSGDALDVVVVENVNILNELDVLKNLKESGTLLVINSADEKFEETKFVEKTLSAKFKTNLVAQHRTLKVV